MGGKTMRLTSFLRNSRSVRCVALLVVVLLGTPAIASNASNTVTPEAPQGAPVFTITKSNVVGGGLERSRSACFDLTGASGQPAAGSTQNDTYVILSGFQVGEGFHDSLFRSAFEDCQP